MALGKCLDALVLVDLREPWRDDGKRREHAEVMVMVATAPNSPKSLHRTVLKSSLSAAHMASLPLIHHRLVVLPS